MKDDAIAHHVIDKLSDLELDNVDLVKLDTDIFKLRLHYQNHKRIIIVDSLIGNYPPGTVLSFSSDEIDSKLAAKIRHAHSIGSIEALKIMQLDNVKLAKAKVFFVGIVAEEIDKGLTVSKSVYASIPKAIDVILELIK